jgi:hypothetical protein
MCDCSFCNEEFDGDEYIEWEYNNYCKTTAEPLSIEEWLKQSEVKK